jgi:hypothetical protein
MSTATTVVGSVVVLLGTFALLGFVLVSSSTATAGDRYATFSAIPERVAAPGEVIELADPAPTDAEAEADSATVAPRGSPSSTTLGACVTSYLAPAPRSSADGAPERTLFRMAGGQTTAPVPTGFVVAPGSAPIAGASEPPSESPRSDGQTSATALPNVRLTTSYTQPLRLRRFGQGPSDSAT